MPEHDQDELSLLRKILKVAREGLPVKSDEETLERLRKKAKGRPPRSVRSPNISVAKQLEKLEKE